MTMKNNSKELRVALNICLEVVEKVGKKLIRHQKKLSDLTITYKDAQGVASNADVEAEEQIIKVLLKNFPETNILAEESAYDLFRGKLDAYRFFEDKEWTWIIDPLDGTNNFLNGLDYYAICICLAHYGEPVLGVVYRPASGECFHAIKGEGAKISNLKDKSRAKKLYQEKNSKKLKNSMLVTGFATEKGEKFDKEFEIFLDMMSKGRGIRRMGSAALDLCYVAKGMFDGFWERGLAPWDTAAASLICEEAGVKVSDYDAKKFSPFNETILAARKPLFNEFSKCFK